MKTMDPIDLLRSGELVWFPDKAFGYVHPTEQHVYGSEYFEEYEERAKNDVSDRLMVARTALVNKHHQGITVDVGAGSCAFIDCRNVLMKGDKDRSHPMTYGYDVNPHTVHRLMSAGIFWDPWEKQMPAACFWDSLEHMLDPSLIIARVKAWAFISLPIFENADHAKASKHYKPNEHLWYFTERGLIWFMKRQGFELIKVSHCEIEVGREDIGAFAFRRIAPKDPEEK